MDMCQQSISRKRGVAFATSPCRRGLTLVELMMVSVVMAIIATTLAALATTVQVSNQQQMGSGLAMQHGQVTIQRIERVIQDATSSSLDSVW